MEAKFKAIYVQQTFISSVLCSSVKRDSSRFKSPCSQKDRKYMFATMSQRAYYRSRGTDCKSLLWEIAIIKSIRHHVKKIASQSFLLSSLWVWPIQFGTNNTFSVDHVISAKSLSRGNFCTRVLVTSACMQAVSSASLVRYIALLLI